MGERFDDIIREYIDFVNLQVGVYMDAMAGFANVKVKVERQVHRARRRAKIKDPGGNEIVVWSSYEDPQKPEIIHSRILRESEYLSANSAGGVNERQQSQGILVFLVSYWEHSIRPRLAHARRVELHQITSNVMGDLRIVRNAILHSKGMLSPSESKRMKSLTDIFGAEQIVSPSYENMHRVFYMIKQDLARLLFDWLGIKDAPVNPDGLRDIAIQRVGHRER